jgi:hypothetical protein
MMSRYCFEPYPVLKHIPYLPVFLLDHIHYFYCEIQAMNTVVDVVGFTLNKELLFLVMARRIPTRSPQT